MVGLPGIIGWITGAVGVVFLATGVRRAGSFGLAIALCCVAGVHLVLLIVTLIIANSGSSSFSGNFGGRNPPSMSFGGSAVPWATMGSAIPQAPFVLDYFTAGMRDYAQAAVSLVYQDLSFRSSAVSVTGMFAGLIETARFVLMGLCIHALIRKRSGNGMRDVAVGMAIAIVVLLVVNLVMGLVVKPSEAARHGVFAAQAVTLAVLIGLHAWAAAMMTGARREV